jgi:3-hydroxyacyl-[acyl-carrier-protein] dehydratase
MSANGSDIFSIRQLTHEGNTIRAALSINADSGILKGHFPGHPVVPGASMLQLVKEVLEQALDAQLRLKKADYLKFMSLIAPGASDVQLEINYKVVEGDFFVTSKLSAGGAVCFKLQGMFAA